MQIFKIEIESLLTCGETKQVSFPFLRKVLSLMRSRSPLLKKADLDWEGTEPHSILEFMDLNRPLLHGHLRGAPLDYKTQINLPVLVATAWRLVRRRRIWDAVFLSRATS
jgi:hypothetical protein